MKKLTVIIIIFVLTHLISGCHPKYYSITNIYFSAAHLQEENPDDRSKNKYECTSVITDRLIFILSYRKEYISHNFSNVCYAKTEKTDNYLLTGTFSLSFDKPFIYKGEEINSGRNIFTIDGVWDRVAMFESETLFCNYVADLVLEFDSNFLQDAVFSPSEDYVVTFSCMSSDDLNFDDTISVSFEPSVNINKTGF